jgi:hypothetical protein
MKPWEVSAEVLRCKNGGYDEGWYVRFFNTLIWQSFLMDLLDDKIELNTEPVKSTLFFEPY